MPHSHLTHWKAYILRTIGDRASRSSAKLCGFVRWVTKATLYCDPGLLSGVEYAKTMPHFNFFFISNAMQFLEFLRILVKRRIGKIWGKPQREVSGAEPLCNNKTTYRLDAMLSSQKCYGISHIMLSQNFSARSESRSGSWLNWCSLGSMCSVSRSM